MAKTSKDALKEVGDLAFERFGTDQPSTIYRIIHRRKDGLRRTDYYDKAEKAVEILDHIENQGHELIGVWEYEMSNLPLSRHPQVMI